MNINWLLDYNPVLLALLATLFTWFLTALGSSIEMTEESGGIPWLPAVIGFLLGGAFLYLIDRILPHLHLGLSIDKAEGIKTPWLPYALSFAAGAMIFVVVEELIPESQSGNETDLSTIGAMIGFATMMFLDVALG
ncbi:MAG: hypothetical protein M0P71_06305 [Melioribacteraceae bacterium]|nr:hypothetical protein [Melioribacteraceae bacterium]